MPGSLKIVGTGFSISGQMTPEALACVREADQVLHILSDPATTAWLERIRPDAKTLTALYDEGKNRHITYEEMTETMLEPAREGQSVCVAFYGHPGVFVTPSHAAKRAADAEGLAARMLPALSAESCLFADLGVDPVARGCHSFEATQFLLRGCPVETASSMVLWQIGSVGVSDYRNSVLWSREGLRVLTDALLDHYPSDHEVVVYEASQFPIADPLILPLALADLAEAEVSVVSTLFIPPLAPAAVDDAGWEHIQDVLGERACPSVPFDRSVAILPPAPRPAAKGGSFQAIGLGYGLAGHLTPQGRAALERADQVFYLVSDPIQGAWLQKLRPDAEALHPLYGENNTAKAFHAAMTERMITAVETGKNVCFAVTGHPSIVVPPALETARDARLAGHRAQVIPGVSIEDCLIAELGFDPGMSGRMIYDATDFLLRPRQLDPTAALVLLQAGTLGEHRYRETTDADPGAIAALTAALRFHYPADHEVVIYETAREPFGQTRLDRVTLGQLVETELSVISTLYLPPIGPYERDHTMAERLGLL
ncbi:MAG: SAM-dependent methyltransferase [Pseudomonadota bacterium]